MLKPIYLKAFICTLTINLFKGETGAKATVHKFLTLNQFSPYSYLFS